MARTKTIKFNNLELTLDRRELPSWVIETLSGGIGKEQAKVLEPVIRDMDVTDKAYAIRVCWNFVWTLCKDKHEYAQMALAILVAWGTLNENSGFQIVIEGIEACFQSPDNSKLLLFTKRSDIKDFAADVIPLQPYRLREIRDEEDED